jgi:hypothetical protein
MVAGAAAAKREGAGRAGRWCSRALVVLGGAIAGTAAAWAVSSAAASADTEPATADLTPITDAATGSLNDVTGAVAGSTGEAAGTAAHVWDEAACHAGAAELPTMAQDAGPRAGSAGGETAACAATGDDASRFSDEETAVGASHAVDGLTDGALVHPVERGLGGLEHFMRKPQDARQVIDRTLTPPREVPNVGAAVWQFLHPRAQGDGLIQLPRVPAGTDGRIPATSPAAPAANGPAVPAQATLAGIPASLQSMPTATPVDAQQGDASGDRDDAPAGTLPVRMPIAPPVAPSAPSGGPSAGGHFDGLLFGASAGSLAAVDNAVIGSVRPGLRFTPFEPGAQPGVTPD